MLSHSFQTCLITCLPKPGCACNWGGGLRNKSGWEAADMVGQWQIQAPTVLCSFKMVGGSSTPLTDTAGDVPNSCQNILTRTSSSKHVTWRWCDPFWRRVCVRICGLQAHFVLATGPPDEWKRSLETRFTGNEEEMEEYNKIQRGAKICTNQPGRYRKREREREGVRVRAEEGRRRSSRWRWDDVQMSHVCSTEPVIWPLFECQVQIQTAAPPSVCVTMRLRTQYHLFS